MRAKPARIMAEIRNTYDVSVDSAWKVYRQWRDELKGDGRGYRTSLAGLSRDKRLVEGIVIDVTQIDYVEGEDYDYDWEVTGIYGE